MDSPRNVTKAIIRATTGRECQSPASDAAEVVVIALMWEFEVVAGKSEEFERFYGADGEWTQLSRRSRSFLGSSFLRDIAVDTRYVLVEYWGEMVVYERHLAQFDAPLKTLQNQRAQFVTQVRPMGVFSALDTPRRAGPTWSRRSGA